MQSITTPDNLLFIITDRCNLRCSMCWYGKKKNAPAPSLWEQFLKDYPFHVFKNIYISGGEPLLTPNFRNIMDVLLEKGANLRLSTNGTLISRQTIRLMAGIQNISISLDGFQQTHERIRGVPGCYRRTLEAIDLLREYVPKADLSISTTLMPENVDEMSDFIDFLNLEKKISVGIQPQVPAFYKNNSAHSITMEGDTIKKMIDVFHTLIKRKDSQMALDNDARYYRKCIDYLEKNFAPIPGCQAGKKIITLFPDGSTGVCWGLPGVKPHLQNTLRGKPLSGDFTRLIRRVNHRRCPGCLFYCYFFPE